MDSGGGVFKAEYSTEPTGEERSSGGPRWVDSVLTEYESGPFGPNHVCLETCLCSRCQKHVWLRKPLCHCKLGYHCRLSFSLDAAMRRKWLLYHCGLAQSTFNDADFCPCLMFLPTQKINLELVEGVDSRDVSETSTAVLEEAERGVNGRELEWSHQTVRLSDP